VQLTKIVYMVALDEVDLIEINPPTNFVLQKIATSFGVEMTHTKKSQRFQVLQKIVDKNLHHFLVLLKILNVNKLE